MIKHRKFLSSIFILLCVYNSFSQYYTTQDIISLNKKKELTIFFIDSISNSIQTIEKKGLFYNSLSNFFFKQKKIRKAIKYEKKELDLYINNGIKDANYHNAIYVLGYYYKLNKEYKKCLSYYKKAAKLNLFPKKKAQALCEIGFIYRIKGKYLESFNFYMKGLKLLQEKGTQNNLIVNSINLGLTCSNIESKKHILTGIKYLKKAIQIINKNPRLNTPYKNYAIYTSLANLSIKPQINNLKQATKYYKYLINFAENKKNNLFQSMAYINYGELLYRKQKDSCLYFLKKSINLNVKPELYNTLIKAESYRNIANYYLWKNDLIKALESINTSLKISLNLNKNDTYPTRIQLLKTTDRLNISKALNTKIKVLNQLYLKNKDSKYLTQIIETVNISDQLIEIILEDSTEASTQFSWRNDVSKIYNYGVYAAKLLGDDNLQFQYSEKNKAFLLTQSINDNNYSLNLPNHIVNEELSYKKQILQLENQVLNTEIKQLKDSLFDIKFAYQNFKDSIQKVYPQHFESKAKVKLTSLQNVQQQIDNETVIVSYAIQDDETTAINISSGLLIGKDKTIPFSIANIKKLKDDLHVYRQLISKPLNGKKEIQQYNTIANSLYNSLFPSEEVKNLIQNKKVVIIPDDNLQNIPFEAFITDTTSNRFLIEDTNISYAYSMSFLNVNNKISRVSEKDFAGFAPIEFQNKNLATLQYSAEEINSINNNLNGTTFTGADVTKDSFFTNASNAKIIHLATHADVSKKPVIHFSKDSLNLHELYTYKNNADLVVLSACETNVGELKKGEGILNLARGFFYSGSKSVVSSLWKVNDAATTGLMTDFYTNLKDHQSKSEALNNAKRKYLNTHSLSEKSPYYWASFILIGDTAPTFESNKFMYWISLGFIGLLLLFFISKKLTNRGK